MQQESTRKPGALATDKGVLVQEKDYRTLSQRTCNRCGYRWWPRSPRPPKRCAECKTPYWNKPRKKGAQSGPKEPTGEQIVAAHNQRLNAALATGPDLSFRKALEVLKQMKASGASWAQMTDRVLRDYGVLLDKDQLKGLAR
jgi:hypothetical protein